MKTKLSRLGSKVWSVLTSGDTVAAFKVAALTLQVIHEIENHRKGHKGKKVGFRLPGDDD